MRITVAVLDKKGDEAQTAALAALKSLRLEKAQCFRIVSPVTDMHASTAIGSVFSETPREDSTQLLKLKNAAFALEGRIYSPISRKPVEASIAKKPQPEREKAIESFIKKTEGDFALLIAEPNRLLAARDPVGVQPLYYGESEAYAALGSNRKVLWKLGIEKPCSFPPGHAAVASRDGFRFQSVRTLAYGEPKPTTMGDAADTLQRLLERSVRQRVRDLKDVAVAFSGGLDSSLIAFLAKKCGVEVHLFHVSLANQTETEEAKKAAEEMKLPLNIHLFREEDVAHVVAKVVELVEEPDPMKTAIGMPFFWAAEKTAEAGFRVLLAGQGADELFGGYQRYVNEYCLHGEEKTRITMFADVKNIHESNIERDEKICGFHDVELRLPFASYGLAEFALSLPLELKIDREASSLRKLVLRKAAVKIGLPSSIVVKRKKAVQYSTGINDALKMVAKKQKMSVRDYVNQIFQKLSSTE